MKKSNLTLLTTHIYLILGNNMVINVVNKVNVGGKWTRLDKQVKNHRKGNYYPRKVGGIIKTWHQTIRLN